jgi:3-oxoacyl-[acyl-carrier protein] reductase
MKTDVAGKVAMISGATRGIGRAVAFGLAAEGAHLSVNGRDVATLEKLAGEIKAEFGVECLAVAGDLTRQDTIDQWIAATESGLGGIDILINNAGATTNTAFPQVTQAVWKEELALKFFSYVALAGAVFPRMKQRGGGSIVNVIGVAAAQPAPNRMIGSAAGSALVSFTKSLSNEGAPFRIRVNAVSPGYVNTHRWVGHLDKVAKSGGDPESVRLSTFEQIPLGRLAEPQDIANAVVFLSSDALAGYITGSTLNVDGGYLRGI